jgi:hypothetical protein
MEPEPDRVLANLATVRGRMADAARRSGRAPDAVRLVAVTKTVGVATVRSLVEAGQADIGENRAQEIRDRARELAGEAVRWHMIGHLQRNKVKYVVPACAMIHSVDSGRVAEAISSRGEAEGVRARCLLEVNVSGEEAKYGASSAEAPALARAVAAMPGVDLAGLMTMAPFVEDAETVRPVFAALRELAARINGEGGLPAPLGELSMGMTQDYEVAIEEGATLVRVGTALFEC